KRAAKREGTGASASEWMRPAASRRAAARERAPRAALSSRAASICARLSPEYRGAASRSPASAPPLNGGVGERRGRSAGGGGRRGGPGGGAPGGWAGAGWAPRPGRGGFARVARGELKGRGRAGDPRRRPRKGERAVGGGMEGAGHPRRGGGSRRSRLPVRP